MARPALQQMLLAVRERRVGKVVVYDPDRLSRNVSHLLLIVDEIRSAGAEVEFVNFQADLSPDGRLLFTVRGAISEFEAYRIKQRMYLGRQARARDGKVSGGTCIFGYRLNSATKRWEIESREAEVVRLMFEWGLEMGSGSIAHRLNTDGVASRFGKPWRQKSVYNILRNETYVGRMPQMNGIGFVTVPPLVSEDQYRRVQMCIDRRKAHPTSNSNHEYLLSGRLVCGICGRNMTSGFGASHTRQGPRRYYGCPGRSERGVDGERLCGSHYWRSDLLDEEVWRKVARVLSDPADIRILASEDTSDASALRELERQAASIEAEQVRLHEERERLVRALRRGVIEEEEMASQSKEILADGKVLAKRAEAVRSQIIALKDRESDLQRAEQVIAGLMNAAPSFDSVRDRRRVLAALDVSVVLGPTDLVRVHVLRH